MSTINDKNNFESWSTINMFQFLVTMKTISDEDSFEDWKDERVTMLKFCVDFEKEMIKIH